MKKLRSYFFLSIATGLVYYSTLSISGCAQIGMPVGGPKDTLPPVLLNAKPENSTVNFKGNRITLTFDEYIQLDNPAQNVLVSPLPKKTPFIDYKLKTVTIKLYDTLKENTTYSLRFGNTIRDLNESNPFTGFDYIFSTGSYIDSLTLSGSVVLAETGKIDSTLTILLYSDISDSAVYKHKPEYITKLDKNGHFTLKYLPSGTFNIFAIKDEGGQYMYNSPEQLFAFADSAIHLDQQYSDTILLYAYQEEKAPPKTSTEKADTTLKFTANLKTGSHDLLQPLTLTFNHPLQIFDSGHIILTDTLFRPIGNVRYSADDTTNKTFSIHYDWPGSTDYRLLIPSEAVTDTNGRHLAKSDTLSFKTKNESDYGSLKLTFKNLEKYRNPVLQLALEGGGTESFPLATNVFEKKLLIPGNYSILIFEDLNQNGKWDTGRYPERQQPEITYRIGEPVAVRANWENERDIEL